MCVGVLVMVCVCVCVCMYWCVRVCVLFVNVCLTYGKDVGDLAVSKSVSSFQSLGFISGTSVCHHYQYVVHTTSVPVSLEDIIRL